MLTVGNEFVSAEPILNLFLLFLYLFKSKNIWQTRV